MFFEKQSGRRHFLENVDFRENSGVAGVQISKTFESTFGLQLHFWRMETAQDIVGF
jgi:hypothetical protein